MADAVNGKVIVVGVTGSIAAYKAAELVSRLAQRGAQVHVVMSAHAPRFVAPLTFRTLSGHPVVEDMFAAPEQWEVAHVSLADRADLVVVAPATANVIAKLAGGVADDMLTSLVLATRAPVLVAPAMNSKMLAHPATQANLRRLAELNYRVIEPDTGMLACGYEGKGRLADPATILGRIEQELSPRRDLEGLRVMVTAGPTREWLDPVRYLSNPASGKMGYALAEAAAARGAEVVLVSGPTNLPAPPGVTLERVETTVQMCEAALAAAKGADLVLAAAAPVDWRPQEQAGQKIKKAPGPPTLRLVENPDLLASLGRETGRVVVGFAAETENLVKNARAKLAAKGADLVVANDLGAPGAGFGGDTNQVVLVGAQGEPEALPLMSKRELADRILDRTLGLLQQQRGKE